MKWFSIFLVAIIALQCISGKPARREDNRRDLEDDKGNGRKKGHAHSNKYKESDVNLSKLLDLMGEHGSSFGKNAISLGGVVGSLSGNLTNIDIGEFSVIILQVVETISIVLGTNYESVISAFTAVFDSLSNLIKSAIEESIEAVARAIATLIDTVSLIVTEVDLENEVDAKAVVVLFLALEAVLYIAETVIVEIVEIVFEIVSEIIEVVLEAISSAFEEIFSVVKTISDLFENVGEGVVSFVVDFFEISKVLNLVASSFSETVILINGLLEGVTDITTTMTSGVAGVTGQLRGLTGRHSRGHAMTIMYTK